MPVPMFHGLGFGLLTLTLGLGGTVLTSRRFDAEATLAQASEHRAHALTVVPVMLARILDLSDDVRARYPVPSLRVVVSSGAGLIRAWPGGSRRHTATSSSTVTAHRKSGSALSQRRPTFGKHPRR